MPLLASPLLQVKLGEGIAIATWELCRHAVAITVRFGLQKKGDPGANVDVCK